MHREDGETRDDWKKTFFPSRSEITFRKAIYQPGTKVVLRYTSDPFTKLEPGTTGQVEQVDDAGTVHVLWNDEANHRLGMVPEDGDRIDIVRDVVE
jgi:hypothetical protein